MTVLIAGCASVSVQPLARMSPLKNSEKPQRIIVADFGIPQSASIRVDREGSELKEFERKMEDSLRDELIKDLKPFGIAVEAAGSSGEEALKKTRQPAWLIAGDFTRVNQGSRALRIAVGLGAGGTKMETKVRIYDLSARGGKNPKPILEFKTTGGSNAEPGVVFSAGPGLVTSAASAGVTVISSGLHGVSEDTHRTARMIADYVSEELAAHGAIPATLAIKAKHLGQE